MKIITGSTGSAHITSDDDRQFNMAIFGKDYVLPNGSKMAATLVNNNLITIADGDLCMQGCFARINANTSENCTIATGAVGKKRIDLICARYQLDTETGYESVNLIVVKGNETAGTPSAPTINDTTSLRAGATIHDMPLYKVTLNGVNVDSVEKVFKEIKSVSSAIDEIADINKKMEIVSGTLTAGTTSLVINNSRITSSSIINPYFWVEDGTAVEPVSYSTIKVETGKVTMTFDALDYNLSVGISIG